MSVSAGGTRAAAISENAVHVLSMPPEQRVPNRLLPLAGLFLNERGKTVLQDAPRKGDLKEHREIPENLRARVEWFTADPAQRKALPVGSHKSQNRLNSE